MNDYISRQAAIDALLMDAREHDWTYPATAIEALKKLPGVCIDAEELKEG